MGNISFHHAITGYSNFIRVRLRTNTDAPPDLRVGVTGEAAVIFGVDLGYLLGRKLGNLAQRI